MPRDSEYDDLFRQASETHGVSYDLLKQVAWVESRFNNRAVSPTKPRGLMQFTKATGNAYGLVTDEDFFDPQKSIDAGARYLSDLTKKFNGDELKAALAYNQGEGKTGAPQLHAYDTNQFQLISKEGRKYLKNMLGVANSPKKEALARLNLRTATEGYTKTPSVDLDVNLPEEPRGLNFSQNEGTSTPDRPFQHDYWLKRGTTLEEANERSTWFGFKDALSAELSNSTLGVAYRAARSEHGMDTLLDVFKPSRFNTHVFTPDELERIRKEVKNPDYIHVVLGGNAETLDDLIKLANDSYEADVKAADSGLMSKLSAGVLGGALDPLTYIPIVGNTAKGTRLISKIASTGLQSGALNVASESLRTSVAGGDADFSKAFLGGAIVGGGLTAIADGISRVVGRNSNRENPFASSAARYEARETARNTDGPDLSKMPPSFLEGKVMSNHRGVEFFPMANGDVVLKDGTIISAGHPLNPLTNRNYQAALNGQVPPSPSSTVAGAGNAGGSSGGAGTGSSSSSSGYGGIIPPSSSPNPPNPSPSQNVPERAAWGVQLGAVGELGLKILRSQNDDIRRIGIDLVRSPTGMESGSHGKYGATASDISERLSSTDKVTYRKLEDAIKDALKDPSYTLGTHKGDPLGARQELYRKASAAVENPSLFPQLNPLEKQVATIIKEHFSHKWNLWENPSVFGNNVKGVSSKFTRHAGTYVPNVYSREARNFWIDQLGTREQLQDAIADSWMQSYRNRIDVRKRVDLELQRVNKTKTITPDMVRKYAHDKAYGISHLDEFYGKPNGLLEDLSGINGLENNAYLKARNLFDSDMAIMVKGGKTFSVNDLREFDMHKIMPAYDRRMNGDIAILGGTGKTTKQLKEEIDRLLRQARGVKSGTMKTEVEALIEALKIITGRARRPGNDDTISGYLADTLSNLGFLSKSTLMWTNNLMEPAAMIAKGNTRALAHGVPMLNELMHRNIPLPAHEIKELHSSLFGIELDDIIRPTRQDIISRLRENSGAPQWLAEAVASAKYGTQEASARMPTTKLLNATTNLFIDATRQGVLGDVVKHALTGKGAEKWIKGDMLRSASLTKNQWNDIQQLIKDNVVRNPNGQGYTIPNKEKLIYDPRAMHLWRLADKAADEAVLRPQKVSLRDSKALSPWLRMVLQFKNYVIKAVNSKFIRSAHEAFKNGRKMDMALTAIVGMGMASSVYVMQAHIKSWGLPPEKRKAYLQNALDLNNVAYATLSRSTHLGAPLSIANYFMAPLGFDQGALVRSTVLPKEYVPKNSNRRDKPLTARDIRNTFLGNVGEQVPALNWPANLLSFGYDAIQHYNARDKATELEMMKGMHDAVREMVPNDPITQQIILNIYNEMGMTIK